MHPLAVAPLLSALTCAPPTAVVLHHLCIPPALQELTHAIANFDKERGARIKAAQAKIGAAKKAVEGAKKALKAAQAALQGALAEAEAADCERAALGEQLAAARKAAKELEQQVCVCVGGSAVWRCGDAMAQSVAVSDLSSAVSKDCM